MAVMTFDQYQSLARRTQDKTLTNRDQLEHALWGLSSEVGEICGIYQKLHQHHPVDEKAVADEMGDVLWFLAELADYLGISLDSVAEHNICKLLKRYPEGFSGERSVNREEYQNA